MYTNTFCDSKKASESLELSARRLDEVLATFCVPTFTENGRLNGVERRRRAPWDGDIPHGKEK